MAGSSYISENDSILEDASILEDECLIHEETVNPFTNRTANISIPEYIKYVVMVPVVLIRIIFMILVLLWMFIWSSIATCCLSQEPDPTTQDLLPLSCFRRWLMTPFQYGIRALLWSLGYLWIHERGCCQCYNPCSGQPYPAPIIVCNHVSFVDPAWLFYKFLPCGAGASYLAKVKL